MKFCFRDCVKKENFGMALIEYCCDPKNQPPLDCAIAKFRNNRYPYKINKGFYEAFFVLEGECFIEFDDEVIQLSKYDFFVIEPGKKHSTYAEFADVMICCTPPFDIKNVTFCNT